MPCSLESEEASKQNVVRTLGRYYHVFAPVVARTARWHLYGYIFMHRCACQTMNGDKAETLRPDSVIVTRM